MTHPARRLTAPDGTVAAIDTLLVPLIKALWAAGYETIGSCQDIGESSGHSVERRGTYWKGYVLLEMPEQDACRLLDEIKYTPQFQDRMHWAAPGAWEVSLPVMPFVPFGDGAAVMDLAQVHFPSDQIDDLIKVITEA